MHTISLLAAAGLLAASGGFALAGQPSAPSSFHQLYPYGDHGARQVGSHATNTTGTRCNGVSYGTGAQTCGTATGGPVGGITSRN